MRTLSVDGRWGHARNLVQDSTLSMSDRPDSTTGLPLNNVGGYFSNGLTLGTVWDPALEEKVVEVVTTNAVNNHGVIVSQAFSADPPRPRAPVADAGERWTVSIWASLPGADFQIGLRPCASTKVDSPPAPTINSVIASVAGWYRYSQTADVSSSAVGYFIALQLLSLDPPPSGTVMRFARPQIERGGLTPYERTVADR